ncbi:ThuA domain-containing protein [Streptomyces sp. NPDC014861]|uniref:ThuA domain-containing protein n=1 Tax=Streptomyces sp. NPDC014861 TaxID=3364923 RepID=UPI00370201FF
MPAPDVLVYTRTAGYRHASIPDAADALAGLAARRGLAAEATEDPAAFTAAGLAGRALVVLASTTGTVLTPEGRTALEAYLRGGGALLAVHAAANAEPDWPFYGDLLGTRFAGHPPFQPGAVLVEDARHPAAAPLPPRWEWTDEWYEYTSHPRTPDAHVLLCADETAYEGGTLGDDHPIAWCRTVDRGRFLFTALGHAPEAYRDPYFLAHLDGALAWLLG